MLVGLKLVEPSSVAFLRDMTGSVDFIELMAVTGNDYSAFRRFDLPVVIHNMHFSWGVNFVNPGREGRNRESLEFSLKLADEFGAKHVIVHPERVEDDSCSEDQLVRLLEDFPDRRIIIENMPYVGEGCRFYAYDRDTMKVILERTRRGMCLDFPHAGEAAAALGKDPVEHVGELMSLGPAHFHMSDTVLGSGRDMHAHLGDGDLPLEAFRRMLPGDAWVTLETPHEPKRTLDDIWFLKG